MGAGLYLCSDCPTSLSTLRVMQAYTRALDLDPQRLYSWVQSGSIRFTLGEYAEGLKDFARWVDD